MSVQMQELTAPLKILLLKLSKSRSQGFTLLDVLVAMLVLTAFISTSMTAMATSVLMKNRARTTTEANHWIEQDLEQIKNQASMVTYAIAADAASGQDRITLVNAYGLAAGEQIAIARDATLYTIQSVSGNTVRLTSSLVFSANRSSVVSPVSKCKATASGTGLGSALQQSLPAVTNSGTQTFSNKTFILSRQTRISANAPFQVLQLIYSVTPQGGRTPVATMYTEVIPNAVFHCPSV